MGLGKIALIVLMLSPLIYAVESASLRSYKVIALAILSGVLLLLCGVRGLRKWEVLLVTLFCSVLVIQQLVIPNGSVAFGAQYALVLGSMFVPAWALQSAHSRLRNLEGASELAWTILYAIVIVSIYASFFFGAGEVHTGKGTARAFAWLGDSITPVIIFLIIFFTLQQRWIRVMALFAALYMTGGKAATVMLAAVPVIYAFVSPMSTGRRLGIGLLIAIPIVLGYVYWDAVVSEIIPGVAFSYHNRLLSFRIGLQYFQDNLWFGVGVNQSLTLIQQAAEVDAGVTGIEEFYPVYQIHNAFLHTAAETGLVGLIIFVLLCAVLVVRAARLVLQAYSWPQTLARSLVISGGLWTISFIVVHQSTGWFEVGHPQLAWLLVIATISEVTYRRATRARARSIRLIQKRVSPASSSLAAPLAIPGGNVS